MDYERSRKAKLNIYVSFIGQVITLVCGIIVPRLILKSFGSEAYGATASITQFLAYITLLEGGIGGVARAALYKPLAEKDYSLTGRILFDIQRFFRGVGFVFIIYVLVLACSFKYFAHFELYDWLSSFFLVIVISISTFAQYFIGITYSLFLQASQKTYITNYLSILSLILNTIAVAILIHFGFSLIIVKLVSSLIFVIRPILLMIYVKSNSSVRITPYKGKSVLKNKWNGLGQHLAYFFHSNTDVAILTLFGNLKLVAVYSVYNMVVASIQNLTVSFTTGMESLFGDMLAKKEYQQLNDTFGYYETMISMISTVLYSVTIALILPFIRLYTAGVADANYELPGFALILIVSSLLFCLRTPYHALIIAAGHFRETQIAAYGEALINICLSLLLVRFYGLFGVAIATLIAVAFRFLYYVVYISRYLIKRKISLFLRRFLLNTVIILVSSFLLRFIVYSTEIDDYFIWIFIGVLSTIFSVLIVAILNYIFYSNDFKSIIRTIKSH